MEKDSLSLLSRTSAGLTRRALLRGSAVTALALAARLAPRRAGGLVPAPIPFSLGVASGDPTHDSVVLWTRLAVDPLNGGGMPAAPIEVEWQVATDARMKHVVRRGTALALPEDGHTIHHRVDGLAPDRWYWYQFKAESELSPIGRTRTFPAPGSHPQRLRFAFVSCQHWESGFYTAWEHLVQEDIDFVIHLGDYIYEGDVSTGGVRQHVPTSEIMTLDDYRNRHAQYRSDVNLQTAHAQFPFIVTWDDHEVANNYAGIVSENNGDADPENDVSLANFRARRARAYKAYFEHMPLDPRLYLKDSSTHLFRHFDWGQLAEFHFLDTRQYRSDQPCSGAKDLLAPVGDDLVIACGDESNPSATMTGAVQEDWLLDGLRRSKSRWNVIAQQVMMAAVDFGPGLALFDPQAAGLQIRNADAWDGYVASRNRLLGGVLDEKIANLIVLTGDIHSSWVAELKADFTNPLSPIVGTEFVGTSISSNFPPEFIPIIEGALLDPANAHVKFFDGAFRGYVRCSVTPERWRSDYRVVDTVLLPTATVRTLKSFIIKHGHAGLLVA
jgi:alkaline phosphatase D